MLLSRVDLFLWLFLGPISTCLKTFNGSVLARALSKVAAMCRLLLDMEADEHASLMFWFCGWRYAFI